MIKEMLLIAVVAIGLLLIPGLNFEANAIPIINPSIHPIKTIGKIIAAIHYVSNPFLLPALIKFKQHLDNPIQKPLEPHSILILHILKHQLPHIDNDIDKN